jgi:hypothetical protein
VKGTKEVCDPLHKGKNYKEIESPPWILAEECLNSLPLDLELVEWSEKVKHLDRS